MEGWQYPCWQKAGAVQSASMRQRGSSWQIFSAQSKPGGQLPAAKARQSVFSGHSARDWHVRYSRQRPVVALVQYWPEGQSASVAQSARAHRPASQMRPWPPHEASLTHRRRHAPPWHTKSRLATWGSTPGRSSRRWHRRADRRPGSPRSAGRTGRPRRPCTGRDPRTGPGGTPGWRRTPRPSRTGTGPPSSEALRAVRGGALGRASQAPPRRPAQRAIGVIQTHRPTPTEAAAPSDTRRPCAGGRGGEQAPESVAPNRSATRALDICLTGGKVPVFHRAMAVAPWHG